MLLVSAGLLYGCSSPAYTEEPSAVSSETEDLFASGTDLFGGGMVRNATLLSGGMDEVFSYELPVISPKELKSIEPEQIHVSGEGNYSVEWDNVSSGGVYKGWYYYYIHLKVCADQEKAAAFFVDSIDLQIDGAAYRYTPECLAFYNPKGLYGKEMPDDQGALLYIDSPEVILPSIPSDPNHPLIITLEVNDDCTLTDFTALDFLEIQLIDCKINRVSAGITEG